MIINQEYLQTTTLYPEVIEVITQYNSDAVKLQILAAEDVAKSYLSRYDIIALFGTEDNPPSCELPILKSIVAQLTAYQLLKIANPNVDLQLYAEEYKMTIKMLCDIRDGNNVLYGAPYAATTEETNNDPVSWNSNPKRKQFF